MAARGDATPAANDATARLASLFASLLHRWIDAHRPIDDFARELATTPLRLARALEVLRGEGYAIEDHPYRGLRLVATPPHLHAGEIARGLATRRVGTRLRVLDAVATTQDAAWEAAEREHPADGLAILAREQTAGRGSRGRAWHSPRDTGLYLSVILEPERLPPAPSILTIAVALAVADALERTTVARAAIDWPNDLVLHGRKVCGVLVESRNLRGSVPTLVAGAGVNLRAPAAGWPPGVEDVAIALDEVGSVPNPSRLAREILRELDAAWCTILDGRVERIRDRWCARAGFLGSTIDVTVRDRRVRGTLLEVTTDLTLVLESEAAGRLTVPAAHVLSLRTRRGAPPRSR